MNIQGYGKAFEEIINQFERQIDFSLPEDYKYFLRKCNGGTPKIRYSTFMIAELNEEIPLQVLYGLAFDNSELDLQTWRNEYEDDLESNSLIIGHDFGSGLIVLINSPEKKGVYYWDHTFNFEQSTEEKNTYKIADSFQAFVDKLKKP